MRKLAFVLVMTAIVVALSISGIGQHSAQGQTATASPGLTPPPPPNNGSPLPTHGPPCPPSGIGAGCPATATATATITPTATLVPLTVGVKLAHKTVNPRSKQKITVTTLPGVDVSFRVTFPNGNKKTHNSTVGDSGAASWSYVQPGSRITYRSRTAKVAVTVTRGTDTASASKKYSIGFARLDVVAQPRAQKRGHAISLWIHTYGNSRVYAALRFHNGARATVYAQTGGNGWSYSPYVVPPGAARGSADVRGYLQSNSHIAGETSFKVT